MKITVIGDTVNVSDIQELANDSASSFQTQLDAALQDGVKHVDIDLSRADFVDCGGLGVLAAREEHVRFREDHQPHRVVLLAGRGDALLDQLDGIPLLDHGRPLNPRPRRQLRWPGQCPAAADRSQGRADP